jgi:type IV secretion system protein VirB8
MARSADIESYLADAHKWDQDLVAKADASRRRAYWVAGAFGALAGMTLLAFNVMLPLKTVEPFVIRVDNTTGITDVVPVYVGKGEVSEAVTRFLLHNYVMIRERYFYAMAEQDYNLVGAYNSPMLNSAWMQAWDRANPESPLVTYRDGSTVRSQVKAISFIKRADGTQDLAQVRFLTGFKQGGAGAETIRHWIATIQYTYGAPSKDEQLRALNPLGFRVLEYRREPEIVADAGPSATSASTTNSGAGP